MQRRTSLRWRLVGFTSVLLLILGVLFGPARTAWSDDVDKLFEQGNAALKKGDYKTAYEKLSKAWESRKSWDIAANLAQAEEEVGKKRDAAEHLAYALAHYPPSHSDKVKAGMTEMLDRLRPGLVELAISTDEGASVVVDGRKLGVAPLAHAAFVEPGEHTFTAEKGSSKGSVTLTFRAGTKEKVLIKLTPSSSAWQVPSATASASASAAPSATASTSALPPRDAPPKWPGFVVGGIGLAGMAVGGALMGAGAGSFSDAEDAGRNLESPCSGNETTGPCGDIGSDLESADTLHNAGLGTLIASSAVLAAGIATVIWSFTADSPAPDEARLDVTPVIQPGAQGLWVRLTF